MEDTPVSRLQDHPFGAVPPVSVVRAFIAVEVGEAVAQRAAEVIERLRGADGVKWVDPRNFHLTVKFLGETPREELPRLAAALRETAGRFPPFEMELAGVGAFPNSRRPQVVWLGVGAGQEALAALTEVTEAACAELGWARETKPFRAHLTLGRVRPPRPGRAGPAHSGRGAAAGPDLARALESVRDSAAGSTRIERLVLMQSQLQTQGPIYTVLDSFPLGGSHEADRHQPSAINHQPPAS